MPAVGDAYLCSQIVLPVAASSAVTISSCEKRARDGPAGRYIEYNRVPSASTIEWPSPNGRDHSRLGPVAGQDAARPVAVDMKSRVGPPHCVHDSGGVCAKAPLA